ncbi:MAG: host factor Hfq [Acidobacteria bacterium OLB17]|nr:MAG: host factor Hfq [Acidobacteria bacterium OLB17]MCZ2390159.1 RNA chaperone Hfq [Acidobacteriota bacterium]
MEKQAAQNIQDAFLNSARRERLNVVVHLLQGATLTGRIKSFDKFSLLLDVGGPDVLVFKHAISSITQERRPAPQTPAPAEQNQA